MLLRINNHIAGITGSAFSSGRYVWRDNIPVHNRFMLSVKCCNLCI